MQYVLGVDGGGTKTHIRCVDEMGNVVGEGLSGPTNLTTTAVGAASFNLVEGVRQATEKLPPKPSIRKAVMGLAGLDTQAEIETAKTVFSQAVADLEIHNLVLVNDTVIALESGSDKPNAITLIAGTGSNCFGHNEEGETAKAGGMDFLLADQGAGYAIGRDTLRLAVKSFDGRAPKSLIEELVRKHFNIPNITELKTVVYHPPLTKAEVAEIARICLDAFQQGDAGARQIFDKAINELLIMSETVLKKLHMEDRDVDCVLVGGITRIAYFREQLAVKFTQKFPKLCLVLPTQAPVYGAVKLALRP
jgi:N-acetylglucosamine kinase-like BadF-type ATPase